MKVKLFTTLTVTALLLLPLAASAQTPGATPAVGKTGQSPTSAPTPTTPASTDAKPTAEGKGRRAGKRPDFGVLFGRLDTDKDGRLSKDEFMKMPSMRGGVRGKPRDARKGATTENSKTESPAEEKKDAKGNQTESDPSGTGTTRAGRGTGDAGKPDAK